MRVGALAIVKRVPECPATRARPGWYAYRVPRGIAQATGDGNKTSQATPRCSRVVLFLA
jgi:hypothetical protein